MTENAGALAAWLEQRLQHERQELEVRHERLLQEFCREASCSSLRPVDVSDVTVLEDNKRTEAPAWCEPEASESERDVILPELEAVLPAEVKPTLNRTASTVASSSRRSIGSNGQSRHNEPKTCVESMVLSLKFDTCFAALILANAIAIASEVQFNSVALSEKVGLQEGDFSAEDSRPTTIFIIIDVVFGIVFWVELLLKLWVQKLQFLRSRWNAFDSAVMLAWTVDVIATALQTSLLLLNPTLLRVCRLARLVRLVRLVRQHTIFDALALMVSSIGASLWVLLWATILLSVIMVMVGLILNFFMEGYIAQGPDEELDQRRKIYLLFGSFTRSMVTMFEVTMGNWMPVCRSLMKVSEWYGLLFMSYRLLVSFAVIRVIGAIFLCETLKCASLDDDLMIQQKERSKNKFSQKMQFLFTEADSSGDGVVSCDEFVSILKNPRVKLWLQAMELNIHDPAKLFVMLDSEGDGELDAAELIAGMAQLKGPSAQLSLAIAERELLAEFRDLRVAHAELRLEQRRQAEGIRSLGVQHGGFLQDGVPARIERQTSRSEVDLDVV